MKDFNEFCKEYICGKLEEMEGVTCYACDMAYTLVESDNINGTMTYSTKTAIDYIREWWCDCADFSDYEAMNFGERSNPFANPEAFMMRMVIEGINFILSQCQIIDENWNDEIELTPEVIEAIKEQIEDKQVNFGEMKRVFISAYQYSVKMCQAWGWLHSVAARDLKNGDIAANN